MVFNFLMSPIKAYKLQYFMLSFFFFSEGCTDMKESQKRSPRRSRWKTANRRLKQTLKHGLKEKMDKTYRARC